MLTPKKTPMVVAPTIASRLGATLAPESFR
jgi:hypothetical protein